MYSSETPWEACTRVSWELAEARWSRSMLKAVQEVLRKSLCRLSVGWLEGLRAILSKWFLPTRLETRTKESKTNASMVVEKPTCEMKVNDAKTTAASTDFFLLEEV